jgi:hypothetical protein
MLGGKRFTPGVYLINDKAVLEDYRREHLAGVFLDYTDEEVEAPVALVETYSEPAPSGPLTKAMLENPDALKACETCGRTYKSEHTCGGPDDVGTGDGEVAADTGEEPTSDAPADDSTAPADGTTPDTADGEPAPDAVLTESDVDAGLDEPATHCPCPDDCRCVECPSCAAAAGL